MDTTCCTHCLAQELLLTLPPVHPSLVPFTLVSQCTGKLVGSVSPQPQSRSVHIMEAAVGGRAAAPRQGGSQGQHTAAAGMGGTGMGGYQVTQKEEGSRGRNLCQVAIEVSSIKKQGFC